jgi:hypothetical protein
MKHILTYIYALILFLYNRIFIIKGLSILETQEKTFRNFQYRNGKKSIFYRNGNEMIGIAKQKVEINRIKESFSKVFVINFFVKEKEINIYNEINSIDIMMMHHINSLIKHITKNEKENK